jgi:hypothetical protein
MTRVDFVRFFKNSQESWKSIVKLTKQKELVDY